MAGEIRVGTSGWSYPHWAGDLYPAGLPATKRLAFYAHRFDTVEINASFYRVPAEGAAARWAVQAPPGFLFAWKASRYITGAKKLLDVGESLAFVLARMAPLGDREGPVLFQLPPGFRINLERLETFLALLPAKRRYAIEFRDPSWYADPVFDRLSQAGVALCVADHHRAPAPWVHTASFVYVRGHGPSGRYFGRYGAAELDRWAQRIAAWTGKGLDAFVYFDNDIGGAAPRDASALKAKLAGSSRVSGAEA
ncbi:MAG: DUF72 domain-containing protein [Caulobacteraceae bacterium]|nr:DUF72 domain-containing protein [Caulobacteraceae bacterium]